VHARRCFAVGGDTRYPVFPRAGKKYARRSFMPEGQGQRGPSRSSLRTIRVSLYHRRQGYLTQEERYPTDYGGRSACGTPGTLQRDRIARRDYFHDVDPESGNVDTYATGRLDFDRAPHPHT
jgi:hypothetical protein